ncbi:hypothetical protein EGW08_019325, partial [Elysia chlorotica]
MTLRFVTYHLNVSLGEITLLLSHEIYNNLATSYGFWQRNEQPLDKPAPRCFVNLLGTVGCTDDQNAIFRLSCRAILPSNQTRIRPLRQQRVDLIDENDGRLVASGDSEQRAHHLLTLS